MAFSYRDKQHFKSRVIGSSDKASLMIGLIEPDVYCFGFYAEGDNDAPKFYYTTSQLYNFLDSDLEEKKHFFGGGESSIIYGINYRRREAFFTRGHGGTYIVRRIQSCLFSSEKFNIAREIRFLPENNTQQAIIHTLRKRFGLGREEICRDNLFEMASLRAFCWYATYMAYIRSSSPSSSSSSSSSDVD
ncbi:MAG: hypothetical protein GY738_14335 [Pseudoalteromonas sp.]|nr:hypothetical protein [Pseudoalteromonas sp.]